MPWPISAGVFGIARTTRSLPVAATIASLRTPAITLTCSALADMAGAGRGRGLERLRLDRPDDDCGHFERRSGGERAVTPYWPTRRRRVPSLGSTTTIEAAGRPALTRPPIRACAMLPPPMKTMLRTDASVSTGPRRRDRPPGPQPAAGRRPKIALPTRTIVAPSRIAASRSSLMPAESVSRARPSARSRRTARAGRETAAAAPRGRRPARDGHQAAQAQPRQRRHRMGDGGDLGRREAALARLAADIDLHADRERRRSAGRCALSRSATLRRSIVCTQSNARRRPRLVALQRPDQVPLGCGRSGDERGDLVERLLHVVLAERRWPAACASATASAAEGLPHREQRDALHGASGGRTSACNARVHLGELVCDHCALAP